MCNALIARLEGHAAEHAGAFTYRRQRDDRLSRSVVRCKRFPTPGCREPWIRARRIEAASTPCVKQACRIHEEPTRRRIVGATPEKERDAPELHGRIVTS